jgi:hypothetical protein
VADPARRRRRGAAFVAGLVVVGVALHMGLPALPGLRRSLALVGNARLGWIAIAVVLSIVSLGWATISSTRGGSARSTMARDLA